MYVCVCEREIEREKSKNIIYYTISFIVHICFVTISNIILNRKFLVSHNLVFICFFIFFKFYLMNVIFCERLRCVIKCALSNFREVLLIR